MQVKSVKALQVALTRSEESSSRFGAGDGRLSATAQSCSSNSNAEKLLPDKQTNGSRATAREEMTLNLPWKPILTWRTSARSSKRCCARLTAS